MEKNAKKMEKVYTIPCMFAQSLNRKKTGGFTPKQEKYCLISCLKKRDHNLDLFLFLTRVPVKVVVCLVL